MIGNRSGRSPGEEEAPPTLPLLLWSVAPSLLEHIPPSQMGKTSFATKKEEKKQQQTLITHSTSDFS
jgi:hypothetical protein